MRIALLAPFLPAAATLKANTCGGGGATGAIPSSRSDHVLVWSDEFDYSKNADNEECWSHNWWLPHPDPQQDHNPNGNDTTVVSMTPEGTLRLTVAPQQQPSSSRTWTARLQSKFAVTYGRVEIRAKFHTLPGTRAMLWLLGQDYLNDDSNNDNHNSHSFVPWPYCGEIDLVDAFWHSASPEPALRAAVHTPQQYGSTAHRGYATPNHSYPPNEFQVYTLDWNETTVQVSVNGQAPFFTYQPAIRTAPTWPLDRPHSLLVSVTVGGAELGLGTSTTTRMPPTAASLEVDYIRIYQRESQPPQGAPRPRLAAQWVTPVFSRAYPNTNEDGTTTAHRIQSWNASSTNGSSSSSAQQWQLVLSDTVIQYTNLSQAVVQLYESSFVNSSNLTHFHFSLWTPNAAMNTVLTVTVVDAGMDGVLGTEDDGIVVESTFDHLRRNQWISYTVSLVDPNGNAPLRQARIGQILFAASSTIRTVYLDHLYLFQHVSEPDVPAPRPTRSPEQVVSLWTDDSFLYQDVAVDTWMTSWSVAASVKEYSIPAAVPNNPTTKSHFVQKYTNVSFVGIEFVTHAVNASELTGLHLDVWMPFMMTSTVRPHKENEGWTALKIKLVDFGPNLVFQNGEHQTGDNDDSEFEVSLSNLTLGTWMRLDLPFALFPGLTPRREHVTQLIVSGQHGLQVLDSLFLSNVYFYVDDPGNEPAPVPTDSPSSVVALYSNVYDTVPVDTWLSDWSGPTVHWNPDYTIGDTNNNHDSVLKYSTLTWVGVETRTQPLDASFMTGFRMHLWTPECWVFRVKFTDLGNGEDIVQSEHEILVDNLVPKEWISIDIAVSSLSNLQSMSHIGELIWSADWLCTAYIDNVYFYGSSQPTQAAPTPTAYMEAAEDTVISLDLSSASIPPSSPMSGVAGTVDDITSTAELVNLEVLYIPQTAGDVPDYPILTFVNQPDLSDEAAIEMTPMDVSDMTHFHVHLWTLDCPRMGIKLVDAGPNGVLDCTINTNNDPNCVSDDSEQGIVIDTRLQEWIAVDIALSPSLGLTNVAQVLFFVPPVDTMTTVSSSSCTVYLDNLLFYSQQPQGAVSSSPASQGQPLRHTPLRSWKHVIAMESDSSFSPRSRASQGTRVSMTSGLVWMTSVYWIGWYVILWLSC